LGSGNGSLQFVAANQTVKGVDVAAPVGNFTAASFGLPSSRMAALASAGFNTLRCFISMDDFLAATTTPAMNAAVAKWVGYVGQMTSAGFKVFISWASSYAQRIDLCGGTTEMQFRAALAAFTQGLAASFTTDQVALEIMNEPPNDSDMPAGRSWNTSVAGFFQAIRGVAFPVSVIVQSSELGYVSSFGKLPVSGFDANTIYSFHEYSPASFTHQSVSPRPYPGLYRVPYPVATYSGGQSQMIADMTARVNADGTISNKSAQITADTAEINGMFAAGPLGTQSMLAAGRWDALISWATANSLSPKQIMCGEFGVNGDINQTGILGADLTSRCNYMRDVRQGVETKGWGGWVAHQAMGDFNLFQQTDYSTHGTALIPELVTALFS
jgi:hypothetical protein